MPFESPDFIIKNANEILGVEIIDYVRKQSETGSPKRHEEIVQNQLCSKAKEKFESRHGEKLLVSCQPSVHKSLSDLNHTQREKIIDLLLEKIKESIPISFFTVDKVDIKWNTDKVLNQFISSISMMKVREKGCWSFVKADYITASKEGIQSIIDRKNKKINEYKKSCEKNWLIVVARDFPMSSFVDITGILDVPFFSEFEKVLFLYQDEKRIFELNSIKLRGNNDTD